MEFKELILLFKKNWILFLGIFCTFIAFGMIFFLFQKEKNIANLMINVTRKGVQQTQNYRYDNFYRLQADERFADTVVRWVSSPSILNEIKSKSKFETGEFEVRRLSSQMIEVIFLVKNKKEAEGISSAIIRTLNEQTDRLNDFQKDDTWFFLVESPVQIVDGKINLKIIFSASLMLGLFFAIMGVMMKNYFKD